MKEKLERLLDNETASIYYKFKVAAIVVTKDGKEYNGVNIENAIPALSDCAERVAIYSALTDKVKGSDIKEVHVMAEKTDFCMPCLTCRQIMLEHCPDIKIYTYDHYDKVKEYKLKDIVVNPYTNKDLDPFIEGEI